MSDLLHGFGLPGWLLYAFLAGPLWAIVLLLLRLFGVRGRGQPSVATDGSPLDKLPDRSVVLVAAMTTLFYGTLTDSVYEGVCRNYLQHPEGGPYLYKQLRTTLEIESAGCKQVLHRVIPDSTTELDRMRFTMDTIRKNTKLRQTLGKVCGDYGFHQKKDNHTKADNFWIEFFTQLLSDFNATDVNQLFLNLLTMEGISDCPSPNHNPVEAKTCLIRNTGIFDHEGRSRLQFIEAVVKTKPYLI